MNRAVAFIIVSCLFVVAVLADPSAPAKYKLILGALLLIMLVCLVGIIVGLRKIAHSRMCVNHYDDNSVETVQCPKCGGVGLLLLGEKIPEHMYLENGRTENGLPFFQSPQANVDTCDRCQGNCRVPRFKQTVSERPVPDWAQTEVKWWND